MIARSCSLLMAVLFLSACADTQPEAADAASAEVAAASEDEAALEQLRADYESHYNQHHAAVVAGLFTDSAFGLWADGEITMGRAAIQTSLEADMAASPTLALETDDVMVFGDHAVARGTYTVNTTPAGAAPVTMAGNYLTHFEKVGGQWRINGVLSNFNAPPPEGTPIQEMTGEEPPEEGTMTELVNAFTQALAASDWQALGNLYTEDATASFTNSTPVQGRAAIQARFQERFPGGATIEIHDVATVDLGDNFALDGGWFTLNGTTPEGAVTQTGTYMNLVRRDADGSWKIHWNISNGQPKPAM